MITVLGVILSIIFGMALGFGMCLLVGFSLGIAIKMGEDRQDNKSNDSK